MTTVKTTKTTTTKPGWVTITRRSRSLGFGSTSHLERDERGNLVVKRVAGPDVTGSVKAIRAEIERVYRIYSGGTSHRVALFVGGERVLGGRDAITAAMAELEVDGSTEVCVDEAAWAEHCAAREAFSRRFWG